MEKEFKMELDDSNEKGNNMGAKGPSSQENVDSKGLEHIGYIFQVLDKMSSKYHQNFCIFCNPMNEKILLLTETGNKMTAI